MALEHLRKPSIKPSRESDSMFIPLEPKSDIVPMDIDIGSSKRNPGTVQSDPGTVQSDSGTAQPMSIDSSSGGQLGSQLNSGTVQPMLVEANSVQRRHASSQKTLSANDVMAISDFVDSISANRGIACPNSGTSQCLPVAT